MAPPTPSSAPAPAAPPSIGGFPPDFWRAFGIMLGIVLPLLLWRIHCALSGSSGALPAEIYHEVEVHFAGQDAVLTGRVLDAAQFNAAETYAREKLRSGSGWGPDALNPIRHVRNELIIRPNPPGILVVIRERENSMVSGETDTAALQDQLLYTLTAALPPNADTLLLRTATERGPCGDLGVTLDSLQSLLQAAPANDPVLLASTLGQPAQVLEVTAEDAVLEATFKAQRWDWEHSLPLIQQLRRWITEAAEWDRRMKLPLPHLTLLAAGTEVWLRGEVSTSAMRDELLAAARDFYGQDHLHADLRLTPDRCPLAPAAATIHSFPPRPSPQESGLLAFAVPSREWRSVDLPATGFTWETLPSLGLFPAEFESPLAQADLEILATQHDQHRESLAAMALAATYPVPFVALLLMGSEVHLHGEVPTTALHSDLLSAATKAYPAHAITDHVRVNEKRRPLTPEHTAQFLTHLPAAPIPTAPGVLAFIIPGMAWDAENVPPVELRPEEFDEFVHFNLIPSSFPLDDAKADFTEFRTLLKAHFKSTPSMNLSQAPPEPYLAYLALGKRIHLCGNPGSEPFKKAVLEGIQKHYPDREIIDEMHVTSQPPIPLNPSLTLKSFPPRCVPDGPGILAFCHSGQPWLQVPLSWETPTLDWLDSRGLFSKDYDPHAAWTDISHWLPLLAARPLPSTAPKPSAP